MTPVILFTQEELSAIYDAIDAYIEDTDYLMGEGPEAYDDQDHDNWQAKRVTLHTIIDKLPLQPMPHYTDGAETG